MKTLAISLFLFTTLLTAKEHTVEMLSFDPQAGPMVFKPAVLQAEVGDTVKFVPIQPGHQIKSYSIPAKAEPFESKINEPVTITLTHSGVYFYVCQPHITMNMAGLIQVGEPINMQAVANAVNEVEEKSMLNQGRLKDYLKLLNTQGTNSDNAPSKPRTDSDTSVSTPNAS